MDYGPVEPGEIPYAIPPTWRWVRMGDLALASDAGWSPQCLPEARVGNEWAVLKVSAVSWGRFDPAANKALPPGEVPRPQAEVRDGDFLLSRANTEDLVARSVIADDPPPKLMMSDKIVRFVFPDGLVDKRFVNLANSSAAARTYYARNASGTSSSMKNVSRETMGRLPGPLPPLSEQAAIVDKVAELLSHIDRLEENSASANDVGRRLLDAAVRQFTETERP